MKRGIVAVMQLEIWKILMVLLLITGVVCETTHESTVNQTSVNQSPDSRSGTFKSRRSLAEMLRKKGLLSQPQGENCSLKIEIPLLEYQTLAVDTKNLRLSSRVKASLEWTDPDLSWDTSIYPYDEVSMPTKYVWLPELHVTNAITVTKDDTAKDLVVLSNGTLRHDISMNAEVNCEINLFNYPFAADECPVALHTWFKNECGGEMVLREVKMKDGAHGDWKTENIYYHQQADNKNYISVALKIRQNNPFITLMLPSILIILADVVSFALPLGGGERNSFKVTLVLSFTMFLIILNEALPGDSTCGPVIKIHFCVCLIILVFSMLVSMVLTRVAKEGRLFFCCCSKWMSSKNSLVKDEDTVPDISVVQAEPAEEHIRMLRKVVSFLEAQEAKEEESEKYERVADTLDKSFFWFYLVCATAYFIGIIYVMARRTCRVNHFEFWD